MIIPSIDILNGKIVRLYQGKYDIVQHYNYDVFELIEQYLLSGLKVIHIVDLESARNPDKPRNKIFNKIINRFKYCIQFAGGIRCEEDIENLLLNGAKRVVIGTAVINQIKQVKKWIQYYGNEYIVTALDVNTTNNVNNIFINGWEKNTHITLEDTLNQLFYMGIKHVLCTDISRDGTLLGPNLQLYKELIQKFSNIQFQSSGGVSTLNDITELKKIGVYGVIIGKSLLENKFTILEAIQCWQRESSHASM